MHRIGRSRSGGSGVSSPITSTSNLSERSESCAETGGPSTIWPRRSPPDTVSMSMRTRPSQPWQCPVHCATIRVMRYPDIDRLILAFAQRQHGVVARWQLVPAGVPASLIDERLKRRRLERIDRCVYGVPGLDGPRRRLAATVLSFGPHAVASHGAAGELLGLIAQGGPRPAVSVCRGHPGRQDKVLLYRVKLSPDERTERDGIPVTTPARTLLDLAAELPDRPLEQALARGVRLEIVGRDDVVKLIERYPRRPGTPRLRALFAADRTPALTRSEAEERFLALVRRAELPEPGVNVKLRGFEVDFFWRAQSLVVEVDGLGYHSTRAAQQRDRQRDSTLGAAGMHVLRFTWADVTRRPEITLAKVALALGRAGV